MYAKDAAYVSVAKIEEDRLKQVVGIAQVDPTVQASLGGVQSETGAKFINYVLPAEWYLSEALMNVVPGSSGGHYVHDPAIDENQLQALKKWWVSSDFFLC